VTLIGEIVFAPHSPTSYALAEPAEPVAHRYKVKSVLTKFVYGDVIAPMTIVAGADAPYLHFISSIAFDTQ
jgi:hypothetical protein